MRVREQTDPAIAARTARFPPQPLSTLVLSHLLSRARLVNLSRSSLRLHARLFHLSFLRFYWQHRAKTAVDSRIRARIPRTHSSPLLS